MAPIGFVIRTSTQALRLVIVDDEARVAAALSREIRARYGEHEFSIVAFDDPLDYLAVLGAAPPGAVADTPTLDAAAGASPRLVDDFLVISDLRMPTMNGADFLERVRATDRDVRTVLLTAYSDMEDIGRAVSADISGLMAKPWDRKSLYAHIERALSDYRLRKDLARLRDELSSQLSAAGEFQKAMLSKGTLAGASVAYRPVGELGCGGDYYDSFALADGRLAFLVADVSGHGIKPALVTMMLKTVVQHLRCARPTAFSSPSTLLAELNDEACGMLEGSPGVLVAMAAAFVDPSVKVVEVANAGLPPVILCSAGGVKDAFSQDGPALGFERGGRYGERLAEYAPGDALVVYTDGLIDDPCSGDAEDFGGASALIARTVEGGADGIVDAFLERYARASFADDVTALVAIL